jgi:peptide methionine sulfoxide reductase MsrA
MINHSPSFIPRGDKGVCKWKNLKKLPAPLNIFYPAEEYHQNYFRNNPYQPYCQLVVNPKVQKFRKHFAEKLKRQ